MKQYHRSVSLLGIITMVITLLFPLSRTQAAIMCDFVPGDLVKLSTSSNVYVLGPDRLLHQFPTKQVFFSWFDAVTDVQIMQPGCIDEYGVGKVVPMRPGATLVKVPYNPRVYVLLPGGGLRHIKNESIAEKIAGPEWNRHIMDITEQEYLTYGEKEQEINTAEKLEGLLIQPIGSEQVYIIQYGYVFEIADIIPENWKGQIMPFSKTAFEQFTNSVFSLPTITVREARLNDLHRTLSVTNQQDQDIFLKLDNANTLIQRAKANIHISVTPEATNTTIDTTRLDINMVIDQTDCLDKRAGADMAITTVDAAKENSAEIGFGIRAFAADESFYLTLHHLDIQTEQQGLSDTTKQIINKWKEQWVSADSATPEVLDTCEEKTPTAFFNNQYFVVTNKKSGVPDAQTGVPYDVYTINLNKQGIALITRALKAYPGNSASQFDILDLLTTFNRLGNNATLQTGVLRVEPKTHQFKRIDLIFDTHNKKNQKESEVAIQFEYNNINGSYTVERPTASGTFEDMFTELFGSIFADAFSGLESPTTTP